MPIYDISLQPSLQPTQHNVWLISYADGDIHLANQRFLNFSAINKGIDFYLPYNKKHIDPSYIKAHNNTFSQKRGAGYWLWKPYLILKILKQIPKNDVVLYVDCGAALRQPIVPLLKELDNHDIVLVQNHHKNRHFIKRDLLTMFNADNNETRDAYQLIGGFVLVKNTRFARNFIRTWLRWCEKEHALTDTKSQDEHPDFKDHRHDQAILTLLAMQNPARIKIMPHSTFSQYLSLHYRRGFDEGSLF